MQRCEEPVDIVPCEPVPRGINALSCNIAGVTASSFTGARFNAADIVVFESSVQALHANGDELFECDPCGCLCPPTNLSIFEGGVSLRKLFSCLS